VSYLAQLMAQTGIQAGPTLPRASPLAEIDEVHELPPAALPAPQPSPARPLPAVEERLLLRKSGVLAVGIPQPTTVQAARAQSSPCDIPAPHLGPEVRDERTSSFLPVGSPSPKAANPNVVIAERVIQPSSEPTPASAQHVWRERTIDATRGEEHLVREDVRKTFEPSVQAPRAQTLIEVLNWVAATPTLAQATTDPLPAAESALKSELMARPVQAPGVHRRKPDELRDSGTDQRVELSIGTVQVTVEAPAAVPAPAPQPTRQTPALSVPTWSRLSRRYVRL
jgi:hypothetical protein